MKVRFLADADLNKSIVSGVVRREPGVDFVGAQAAGLRGMTDREVLALAAASGRVLVSHDVNTMPHHFREFTRDGRQGGGVLLIPQRLDVGVAVEELILVWSATDADEWVNRVMWLPL